MVNYEFNQQDHPEELSLDYSKQDHEIVDYKYYELDGIPGVKFRGPPLQEDVIASGNYFTCLGGVQANGIFVERTFGDILAEPCSISASAPASISRHPAFAECAEICGGKCGELDEAISRARRENARSFHGSIS